MIRCTTRLPIVVGDVDGRLDFQGGGKRREAGMRGRARGLRIGGLVLLGTLVLVEGVLRLLMGNLSLDALTVANPGDGRCIGLKPNVAVEYTGYLWRIPAVIHDVNELGYRGRAYPRDKPAGVLRIAVLGDSLTYGQGVAAEDTVPAQLERQLATSPSRRRIEVLNFGIAGLNLDEYREQLELFAAEWHPDIVLTYLYGNDLEPPLCEWGEGRVFWWVARHVYLSRLVIFPLRLFANRMRRPQSAAPAVRFQTGLDALLAATARIGARSAMVLLGDPLREEAKRTGSDLNERVLPSKLEKAGVPWLDGRGYWQTLATIPGDGHFTAASNGTIAADTARWLQVVFPLGGAGVP